MSVPGVRRFSLATIAPMPWKNGGGTTREIAVSPAGAGMDDFAWRISVADIAADGPFSAFAGIDRQIVLLDGAGVVLRSREERAREDGFVHRLDRMGEPFAFAGDVAVDATLIDGPTRDFNVMTRRGRCRAVVEAMRTPVRIDGTGATLVLVIAGHWRDGDGEPLAAGDGMLWTDAPGVGPGIEPGVASVARTTLTPQDDAALCLRVAIDGEPR
ncbi:HutD/Ves family protein [Cupriavidus plantarum]|uniref:HutD/Ves family protein n=1 Tax=Cupriavidus plantarum TaxID=942865 RepID=UPI000EB3F5AF|nr:HutD family protein [Cupriavidus plantarum]RLK44287.1 hypothetical protein C7417_0264 [Cupriavidus plantarum]